MRASVAPSIQVMFGKTAMPVVAGGKVRGGQ